jgi:hypothetical protein
MATPFRAAQLTLIALAVAAALLPRPSGVVERLYAAWAYPGLQDTMTRVSNAVPIAVFDAVVLAATGLVLWWWIRAVAAWRARAWRPTLRAVLGTATVAAAAYLWFLGAWGLNYARPSIDARLTLPAGAPTADEVVALLERAIDAVNGDYEAAHADLAASTDRERHEDLASALHAVEARHGRPRPTRVSRPKPTVLAPYFRMAGVDGLTAPLALETLLNPDLTPAERPFVLAHEWAHLSGYADEADANFVAWLTTGESRRVSHRYSGWLFLVSECARQAPRDRRTAAVARLAAGPRADLEAIAARARQRVDVVERLGWRVYDRYLRAQGVDEGVRSYSRVVDLIIRARRPPADKAPT